MFKNMKAFPKAVLFASLAIAVVSAVSFLTPIGTPKPAVPVAVPAPPTQVPAEQAQKPAEVPAVQVQPVQSAPTQPAPAGLTPAPTDAGLANVLGAGKK